MNSRRKARETALQILYSVDISECDPSEAMEAHLEAMRPGSDARLYCERLVSGVLAERKSIDGVIEDASENWTIDRMPPVDRNILRIAVYELRRSADVPFKVVIDEAVELAKRYGSDDSGAFVNGILDNARKAAEEGKAPMRDA
ncbi:MAG: transcription antitermination factor NusB [Deltaproteobacteria bacterium]|nr:transcription antitermination factor NusB [Deltaproteobacteria bacterium]